jgi:hypothetical protein
LPTLKAYCVIVFTQAPAADMRRAEIALTGGKKLLRVPCFQVIPRPNSGTRTNNKILAAMQILPYRANHSRAAPRRLKPTERPYR